MISVENARGRINAMTDGGAGGRSGNIYERLTIKNQPKKRKIYKNFKSSADKADETFQEQR